MLARIYSQKLLKQWCVLLVKEDNFGGRHCHPLPASLSEIMSNFDLIPIVLSCRLLNKVRSKYRPSAQHQPLVFFYLPPVYMYFRIENNGSTKMHFSTISMFLIR